jgi:hypothetical protein
MQKGSGVRNREEGCPSGETLTASEPKNSDRMVQPGPQGLWLDIHLTSQRPAEPHPLPGPDWMGSQKQGPIHTPFDLCMVSLTPQASVPMDVSELSRCTFLCDRGGADTGP